MSQCLPTGGFRWLNELERSELNLEDYRDDSEEGLILEVDLEDPPELHDFHNVCSFSCFDIAEETFNTIKKLEISP